MKSGLKGIDDCRVCGKASELGDPNMALTESTRHQYKGKDDNPVVYCEVSFLDVRTKLPVSLCKKCRATIIRGMTNGGNFI